MRVLGILLPFLFSHVWAIPGERHRKSLAPLHSTQVAEVVEKLRTSQGLNCAFIFDLKTTVDKKTKAETGTFYSQQNAEGIKLRFDFGDRSWVALGRSAGEIFCLDGDGEPHSAALSTALHQCLTIPLPPLSMRFPNSIRLGLFLAFVDIFLTPFAILRSELLLGCAPCGRGDGKIFRWERAIKMTPPIRPGHLLSFADILMPFLDRDAYEYRHPKRVQGRNTHIIRFKEPTGQFVDIAYDPAFEAILQFECFDEKEKLLRAFKLLNFKKIQNTWLMKAIEIKDVPGNTTTQLTIKKVAVGQTIPQNIFDRNGKPFDRDREVFDGDGRSSEDHLIYTHF